MNNLDNCVFKKMQERDQNKTIRLQTCFTARPLPRRLASDTLKKLIQQRPTEFNI